MNNREVIEDFRRRYLNTYVWVYLEAKECEVIALITSVVDDENSVGRITLSTLEFGDLVMNIGSSEYQLKFKYPPVGVFQFGKDAYSFRRIPARQYQRGLCEANSRVRTVTRDLSGRGQDRFGARLVAAAFSKDRFSFIEALKMLEQKKVRSVALKDNYSVTLPMDSSGNYLLFHWNSPVAVVTPGGKIQRVVEQAYSQQIKAIVSEGKE